jgi:predicted DNA-binding transcriptional regulator YafY
MINQTLKRYRIKYEIEKRNWFLHKMQMEGAHIMKKEKKSRIVCLLRYLVKESDEHNPISTRDITEYLDTLGMSVHRETIYDDIALLQESGIDVIKIKSSPNKYFIGTREFEFPELKLLVDAVQSSKFITAKKSEILIEKISNLTSSKRADLLKQGIYFSEDNKPINEKIYYNVDIIHSAIHENKKIHFKYFEYTNEKVKQHKHQGYIYMFSPYTLFWSDDHYYVIGYSKKHWSIISFRVDRMDKIVLTDKKRVLKDENYDPEYYTSQVFNMYSGSKTTVELQCENSLMDVIIDRFGEDVETSIIDDEHFMVTTEVSTSPTFLSWVFQFDGRVKILSPISVIDQMRNMASKYL